MGRFSTLVLATLALALPQVALADPIDNPGPFTLTANSGYISVGTQRFDVNPDAPPTLSGEIDSMGVATIPNLAFPDVVLSFPIIGSVTIRFEALSVASGYINAVTGEGSAAISLRVRLINSFLGPNCRIEPIDLSATTGDSGGLTGVPYDQTTGTATLVSNDFSVPRSTGCNFGSVVDSQLGLPSLAPNNQLLFNTSFDPILVGS